VPRCGSRLEALSSVVVFVLVVDAASVDCFETPLEEQIDLLERSLERMRTTTKAKLRPVRALLLCQRSEVVGNSDWVAKLADFERRHGYIWKFGPLQLGNDESMYSTFAEMATSRTAYRESLGDDGEIEAEEGEEDEGDAPVDFASEGAAGQGKIVGTTSFATSSAFVSETSEGWQQPPRFATETSAAEVTEEALEAHAKAFLSNTDHGASGVMPRLGVPEPATAAAPAAAIESSSCSCQSEGTNGSDISLHFSQMEARLSPSQFQSGDSSLASTSSPCTSARQYEGFNTERSGSSVATTNLDLHYAHFNVAPPQGVLRS